MIKLAPSQGQDQALLQTMERFNEACNYASQVAFREHVFSQFSLHKLVYGSLRVQFGLSAQMAVRAIAEVANSYKADKKTEHAFNPHSAMAYDKRILSWKALDRVSILSLEGRLIIPIRIGEYQQARLDRKIRESDLILRDGTFYLALVIDAPEPSPDDPTGYLGVDLGIKNIAADSDGAVYSGAQINGLRKRHAKLRSKLQARCSRAARRLLVKRKRKESRFVSNINHCISKSLVAKAKDTHRGIALEDLKGIRERTTVRKSQRRQHNSWAFNQLRQFIEYKAKLAGVLMALVDPHYTSQTCPECGCISRSNRPSQSVFSCVSCEYSAFADTVAATNIGRRAACKPATLLASIPYGVGQGKAVCFS